MATKYGGIISYFLAAGATVPAVLRDLRDNTGKLLIEKLPAGAVWSDEIPKLPRAKPSRPRSRPRATAKKKRTR